MLPLSACVCLHLHACAWVAPQAEARRREEEASAELSAAAAALVAQQAAQEEAEQRQGGEVQRLVAEVHTLQVALHAAEARAQDSEAAAAAAVRAATRGGAGGGGGAAGTGVPPRTPSHAGAGAFDGSSAASGQRLNFRSPQKGFAASGAHAATGATGTPGHGGASGAGGAGAGAGAGSGGGGGGGSGGGGGRGSGHDSGGEGSGLAGTVSEGNVVVDLEAGGTLGRRTPRSSNDGYTGGKDHGQRGGHGGDGPGSLAMELFSRGGARGVFQRLSQRPGMSWGVLAYGAFLQFMAVALWLHCNGGQDGPMG